MGKFFGSSASSSTPASSSRGQGGSTQKENKEEETPRRRQSSSGNSRLSIGSEGRHEDRRGSRSRGRGAEGGEGRGGSVGGPAHASAVKSSNGHGDSRRRGRDVGCLTSGDISESRGSSKKRARTSSSRAGCDGIHSQGSTSCAIGLIGKGVSRTHEYGPRRNNSTSTTSAVRQASVDAVTPASHKQHISPPG